MRVAEDVPSFKASKRCPGYCSQAREAASYRAGIYTDQVTVIMVFCTLTFLNFDLTKVINMS